MVARPDTDCRYTLLNNQLTIRYLDGRIERRVLTAVGELCDVLEDVFYWQLPAITNLDSALQQLAIRL
jgi:N-hydroxyarylamine O-acetyltransferase